MKYSMNIRRGLRSPAVCHVGIYIAFRRGLKKILLVRILLTFENAKFEYRDSCKISSQSEKRRCSFTSKESVGLSVSAMPVRDHVKDGKILTHPALAALVIDYEYL
jgi:hypothetical protein